MRRRAAIALAYLLAVSPLFGAIAKIPGRGLEIPVRPSYNGAPILFTAATIDASAEKIAFIGRVYTKDGATKNLSKIGFRFGAVTKNGTTDLQISIQDVSTTSQDPDGTPDQTVLVGNTNITANTWVEKTLGSTRSVAPGDLIAVVVEYSTFVAGDSVIFSGNSAVTNHFVLNQTYVRAFTAAWGGGTSGVSPNLALGFDDGTFGSLYGATCIATVNSHVINTTTTPDEVALEFSLPFPAVVDSGWAHLDADGDFDFVLYDGTTPMSGGTVSVDTNNRSTTAPQTQVFPFGGHITLAANTVYRLAIKPTTTTSLTAYSFDVSSASYWQGQEGGMAFTFTQRADAGAWDASTTTRRLLVGINVIGFDDGVSTGGAPLIGPGGLIGN